MIFRECTVEGISLRTLHHRVGRTGILLIHGNSSCKEVFAKQFAELSKTGCGIVVPDLPGHGASGNSPRPSGTYSFPGYAGILGHLMRRLATRLSMTLDGRSAGMSVWRCWRPIRRCGRSF